MRAFKIGERVRLVREGYDLLGRARSPYGIVVAYKPGRVSRLQVKVRRDGLKGAEWWHRDFWRPAPKEAGRG